MEPNLFSVLFNKTISTVIALGSLFYTAIPGVTPDMGPVEVTANGSVLMVSTRIQHAFSTDLDQIFSSGMDVALHYKIQLVEINGAPRVVKTVALTKTLAYSLLDQTYQVTDSETQESDGDMGLEDAKERWSTLQHLRLAGYEELQPGKEYEVRVTAWLDKIRVQGKEEPLNLMAYWNRTRPLGVSPRFTRSLLEQ
ncbi:MAG: DUF4390 domain-containing protein [Candidatus Neomarinimicrobiota bacterium]|nr:MAG: DUF4390 domain-containing protein [Candidatus Neomarinimicrobiota bacterium]